MNIYIRPDIEKKLRKEDSMSGLINELLHKHFGLSIGAEKPKSQKSGQELQKKVCKHGSTRPDLCVPCNMARAT